MTHDRTPRLETCVTSQSSFGIMHGSPEVAAHQGSYVSRLDDQAGWCTEVLEEDTNMRYSVSSSKTWLDIKVPEIILGALT